ncbi:MAG: Spore coat protein CotH, partial [Myxococcaceae bacterium]|nr:Spore coat protein CotH [Myxococcaceae bacterium]
NYTAPLTTVAGSQPIVPLGAAWRFLKGTSSPPALWKDRNFDDSGWLQGEGAFGYDTNSRYQPATTLSDMNGVYTSVYFRANFTLTALPQALMLGVLVDDGFIAYLNGVEVARANLDDPANYNSLAESGTNPSWTGVLDLASPTNYNPNPSLRWIDISAAANVLVQGRNTLAFQVHNYKKTNTDFLFLAQLDEAKVRYQVSGLSPSQTYYYVMRCSDGASNKNLNTAEVSARPLQMPPPSPVAGLSAVKSGSSVLLRWSPVVTDSAGSPFTAHHYNVYRGTDPNFAPDTAAHTNLIGTATSATYTDAGALSTTTSTYYRVLAVSATGRESYALSALAQKAQLSLGYTPAQENVHWIALPYLAGIADAQTLVNDLNRSPVPGPVRKITRLNPATQALQSLAYDPSGAWVGDNFPVAAGEAYAITLQSNLSQALVGAHNPSLGFNFKFKTDLSNIYWFSLPYNAAYANAQSLLEHLNGGPLPTAVAKLVRYDSATGAPQSTLYLGGQWLGPDFAITPGQGYGIILRSDINGWRPRVTR